MNSDIESFLICLEDVASLNRDKGSHAQRFAKAFRTLHDCALKYANEDAWTGQFSKDGRQDLWLYGEGKATAVQALKELE